MQKRKIIMHDSRERSGRAGGDPTDTLGIKGEIRDQGRFTFV